jgi:molecular chaperone IbpA
MRTFDFAPLYRSTVGFDRMFSMLDQFTGVEDSVPNYPPYNIERASENAYRVSVAVAGFTEADLSIETKENRLTVRGEKQTDDEEKTGDVLYQGIAARTFERRFQLADYVKVKGASLENGLLHVDLVREIPEAMKPRSIPITNSSKLLEVKPSKVATTADAQLYAPPSPAIGIRTVQPMFVYDVISRRPISTNMLARTGSRKRSEMRAATWLPIEMPGREPSSRAPTMR